MRKKKKVTSNYMDAVYEIRDDLPWREKQDGCIELDMEHTGVYPWIAQKFFHRPRVSHIALDHYGTVLWKELDGRHTVFDLVHIMEEKFPDQQDNMMNRVITFLGTLERNGFIRRTRGKEE
jgi:hypothetical protein